MGRYDKIKVWNGSAWVQPSRIRVRANNAWQDFGDNLSDVTKTLEVKHDNQWKRCTLNRSIRVIPGEAYSSGAFNLLPASAFCYNNYVGPSDFKLEFVAKKDTDTDVVVFRSGNSTNKCLFKVEWLASGAFKVTVATQYGSDGTQHSATTTATVKAGNWATVKIIAKKGDYRLTVTVNGTSKTFTNLSYYWCIQNATNQVGQSGVYFKDTFFIQGHYYINSNTAGTKQVTINMNTASGSGNDYTGINHVDTSTTEVIWI